ncbi:MAG TPA: FecR domain-containing protein [Chitinophagaceae bacterium]|nr:FecR domain-containing protein [Chitinophagaceae bacterium]
MMKNFLTVEDVLTDESFLAWFYGEDESHIKEWEEWLSLHPEQKSLIEEATAFMKSTVLSERKVEGSRVEEKLEILHSRMYQAATANPVVAMNSRKRWLWTAAAAILLIVAGYSFWNMGQPAPVLDTAYGQISDNQLPDGSTMILNANSTAELSKGWDEGKDREVWLKGEAFFKVTRTPQKSRFIVHTDNLDVIVTGTQFNVSHRDNKTAVLLTEGSVTIRTHDGKELAMKPGDYVEMADQLVERTATNEDYILAWKESKLAFDKTPLPEVAQIIYHHYGVKVSLADPSVHTKSLTGIMPNNNLDDLLKAIEIAIDVKITRSDSAIIIATNQ